MNQHRTTGNRCTTLAEEFKPGERVCQTPAQDRFFGAIESTSYLAKSDVMKTGGLYLLRLAGLGNTDQPFHAALQDPIINCDRTLAVNGTAS